MKFPAESPQSPDEAGAMMILKEQLRKTRNAGVNLLQDHTIGSKEPEVLALKSTFEWVPPSKSTENETNSNQNKPNQAL